MRRIRLAVMLTALGAASAANAQAGDCRWFGDVMGCKDGRGHWRRVGDDEIIGSYAIAKPKPKPVAAVAPTPTAPPVAAPVAALPADSPPPPPPEATTLAQPLPAPEAQPAPSPPAPVAAPAAAPPQEQAHKSWWRRWLDSIWLDIQTLLRLIGIGR